MEFTCTQENLLSSLQHVTPLTGKNLSLPILHNILVRVEKTQISLHSTNLEIAITSAIRGKVESGGQITVPGKTFHDFISLQPQGKIHILTKGQDVHITSTNSKTVIKGIPAEEFPLIPKIENTKAMFSLETKELRQALSPILPTVSIQESRPELSGVFVQCLGEAITFVGTDSYRLAEYTYKLPQATVSNGSFIVPLRTIQEVLRIFDEGDVQLVFSDNQFMCKNGDVEMVSRLIEGNYPDHKQIIPTQEKTTISVHREEFLQAVKTASLFCKSGINDIELSVNTKEKVLVVVAANNQIGENISTIPATITGEDTTIIFNYRYLIDALNTIPTDNILIGLNDPQSTGVLHPSDQTPLIHLIMPIRQ